MCQLCNLAETMITSIEMRWTPDEICALVREVLKDSPDFPKGHKPEMLQFICVLAVKWAISHDIHPEDYLSQVFLVGQAEYQIETVNRAREKIEATKKSMIDN